MPADIRFYNADGDVLIDVSSNVEVDKSGNVWWTGLSAGTYTWYAKAVSGATSSNASSSWSFTILSSDATKDYFIFTYRDGSNDAGNDICYRILSGSTIGPQMALFSGGTAAFCPNYPSLFTDSNGRIWCTVIWRDAVANVNTDPCALYTYAASVNSHKGGYDYWFYPNGTVAASGASGDGGVGVAGARKGVSWGSLSSNNAMPYKTLQSALYHWHPKIFTNPYNEFMIGCTSGGSITHTTALSTTLDKELWYLSSNNTWYRCPFTIYKETHDNVNARPNNCYAFGATSSNIYAAYTSSGRIVMATSTDCGRSWGTPTTVYDASNTNIVFRDFRDCMSKTKYPDDYARVIVEECDQHSSSDNKQNPLSGSWWIYKINTDNPTQYTRVQVYASGSSTATPGVVPETKGELYNDSLILFGGVAGTGNVYPADAGVSGDPRWLFWWNTSTGDSGAKMFDMSGGKDYPSNYLTAASHTDSCVRTDSNGVIWGCGTGYYGAKDGNSAYKGYVLNPDICSGSTNPSGDYGYNPAKYENVDTSAGGMGASFAIFNN